MIGFDIHLDGDKEDAKILDRCIVALDDDFELSEDPGTDVSIDELYGEDSIDRIENLAIDIASSLPDCEFIIEGYIDSHGEADDFEITYKNKKLVVRHTNWHFHETDENGNEVEFPLDQEYELDIERQEVCPVCGEPLHQGVPVCEDKDGIQYHIWCAETLGIETEII